MKSSTKSKPMGLRIKSRPSNLTIQDWSALFDVQTHEADLIHLKMERSRIKSYYAALIEAMSLPLGSRGIAQPGIFLEGYSLQDRKAYLTFIIPEINSIGEMEAIVSVVGKNNSIEYYKVFGEYIKLEFYGDSNWLAFFDPDKTRKFMGKNTLSGYISIEDYMGDDESIGDTPDDDANEPEVRHTLDDVYREIETLRHYLTTFLNRRYR